VWIIKLHSHQGWLLERCACTNDSILHNSATVCFEFTILVCFVYSSCHDRGGGRGWHPSLWEENCHWLLLSPGQVQTTFQWLKVSLFSVSEHFAVCLWFCLPSRLLSGSNHTVTLCKLTFSAIFLSHGSKIMSYVFETKSMLHCTNWKKKYALRLAF